MSLQDPSSFYLSKVKNGFMLCPSTGIRVPASSYHEGSFHIFPGAPTRVFPTLKEAMDFLAENWSIGIDEKPPLK